MSWIKKGHLGIPRELFKTKKIGFYNILWSPNTPCFSLFDKLQKDKKERNVSLLLSYTIVKDLFER